MNMRKLTVVFAFIVMPGMNKNLSSEENNSSSVAPESDLAIETKATIQFSVDNTVLESLAKSDETIWIDVDTNKHLVLKYRGKGKKQRGNVLLLHSKGENPNHSRLIQPLANQLVNLGWNLFIPNIVQPDYPIVSNTKKQNKNTTLVEQTDSSTANVEENKGNNDPQTQSVKTGEELKDSNNTDLEQVTNKAFQSYSNYQDYYLKLCEAIFDQTKLSNQPMLIIANQKAAYWSLPCLKLTKNETPIIFLQPELPKGVKNNLEKLFSEQTNPYFYFQPDNIKNNPFTRAFEKDLWRAKYQRFNIGLLSRYKLEKEDTFVARMITGWIEKQQKSVL